MKKNIVLVSALAVVLAFSSCKTTQNGYKAAYEKAQATDTIATADESAPQKVVIQTRPESTEKVTQEKLTVLSHEDSFLKAFGVVVGSFANKTNATGLQSNLKSQGYNPVLGQNEQQMYRVIVASFDDKNEAVDFREAFKAKNSENKEFQKSWILQKK